MKLLGFLLLKLFIKAPEILWLSNYKQLKLEHRWN